MDKIYHFTSHNKLLKILKSNSLRFGELQNTNDPKEFLEPQVILTEDYYIPLEKVNRYLHEEKQKYKILCFCMEESEKYLRPRMWAQYSQKHKGCCLIIDKNKFETSLKRKCNNIYYLGREISYTAENQKDLTYYLDAKRNNSYSKFIRDNIEYFLFTKSLAWNMEAEFRYAVYCENEFFVSIEECLVSIVFGYKFPDVLKEKVIKHFKEDKEYLNICWKNGVCYENNLGYSNYKEYLHKKCCNYFQNQLSTFSDKVSTYKWICSLKNKIELLFFYNFITEIQKQKLLDYYDLLDKTSDKRDEFLIKLYNELKNIFEKIEAHIQQKLQKDPTALNKH